MQPVWQTLFLKLLKQNKSTIDFEFKGRSTATIHVKLPWNGSQNILSNKHFSYNKSIVQSCLLRFRVMTVPVMLSVASMFVLNGSFLKWYYCYCFVCGFVMNSWLSHVILYGTLLAPEHFFCSNNWVVVNGGQKPYYLRTLCMCVVEGGVAYLGAQRYHITYIF